MNMNNKQEDSSFIDQKQSLSQNSRITGMNERLLLTMVSLKNQLRRYITLAFRRMNRAWNGSVPLSVDNLILPLSFLIIAVIYLELLLHLLLYRSVDMKMIYPVLFAIPVGIFTGFLSGLFPYHINRAILWLATGALCFIYIIQLIYFKIFKVYFSFQSLGMAEDAFSEFSSDILEAIKGNLGGIILLLVPLLVLALLLENRISYSRRGAKEQGILLGSGIVFQVVAITALLLFGKGDYSPYDLYFKAQVHDMCGKQLGIATMTRLDIMNLLCRGEDLILTDATMQTDNPPIKVEESRNTKNSSVTIKKQSVTIQDKNSKTEEPALPPTPTPIDISPNIMNIDFASLAKKETSNTIRTLHEYFATAPPTNRNKYTGMFKGYNLIMITAEGFSPYAIHPEKTPTLYRLVREGFVFNNFYTALWQTSTSDGEYVAMTGLIPIGTRSMYQGRKNLWPFSLGNQFQQMGIDCRAFHNHTYTYYQRNETHPNLGYTWKAKGNGLVLEQDVWPESDLEMMAATIDDYIEEEQFHVYYLTVSGHMNYTFQGNSMAYKNREAVKDLPCSSDARAYIACQMELDKALDLLIARLEQEGIADRTVIALSADHYPYGWGKKYIDELAGHKVDPYFEIYRNHFILWNPGMKKKIVIDEPCSSLDILPTLSNMFGLEYDSRLLMGRDVLSDAEPLVILANRSFITDKVMYNSETGEVIKLTKEKLPKDYITNMNNIIKNKFQISKSILETDYYRKVFEVSKDE